MEQQKYLVDLREIREIMHRSSRFISLSGLSGIAAGVVALGGAFLAYRTVYADLPDLGYGTVDLSPAALLDLVWIASVTAIMAIGLGIYFTTRKARKEQEKVWDAQTRRLLINLAIPLVTGAMVCLLFLTQGLIGFLAPMTLIFYGLALVNASKFTLDEMRSLGLIEIGLGLMSMAYIGYGLWFWATGFGVLHIVYGIIMQRRYGS